VLWIAAPRAESRRALQLRVHIALECNPEFKMKHKRQLLHSTTAVLPRLSGTPRSPRRNARFEEIGTSTEYD